MTEKSKKYVSDVIHAIDLIQQFTADTTDFISYCEDLKTQSAVERQLVIVGEALNNLRRTETNFVLENDKQIIGFRNRLVHAYDSIDNSIVWAIINLHLANLKTEIESLEF